MKTPMATDKLPRAIRAFAGRSGEKLEELLTQADSVSCF